MERKLKLIISTIIVTTLGFGTITANAALKTYTKQRISGQDRYETAKLIAEGYSTGTLQNVILATGKNYPDALSGAVLAKKLNAPILLVNSNDNTSTFDYISKHLAKDGTIYVLGGEGAISSDIIDELSVQYNMVRLSGITRYDTNVAINSNMKAAQGTPIMVATGESFPDALSISSIAASIGYPIVLVGSDDLPDQEKAYISSIKPSKVYIAGGTGAVSDSIKIEVKAAAGIDDDNNIVRLSGSNRYETSLNIAKYFNMDSDTAALATGVNFPDALAGSVLAAKYNSPIILVDSNAVRQKEYLDKSFYTKLLVFGGTGAVSDATVSNIVNVPAIENDWYEISSDVPRRLYDYPYSSHSFEFATNKELKSHGDFDFGNKYVNSTDFIDAMYNNNPSTIDTSKILYYYNPYVQLDGKWPEDIVNPFVSERKKYHVSSTAEFLTDMSLIYFVDYQSVVRGTIRIKYDSSTDKAYLDKLGLKPDTWYEKDVEIYLEQLAYRQTRQGWNFTGLSITKMKDLSGYMEADD